LKEISASNIIPLFQATEQGLRQITSLTGVTINISYFLLGTYSESITRLYRVEKHPLFLEMQ
jgi:hypothetical protein